MSREIKFRAWLAPRWEDDDDANTMYYDIQNSYDTIADVKPYDPMTNFREWFDDEHAIIEQYTGLEDKNDKEIYEGDIISETSDLGEDFDYHFKYIVYWNEDNLCWSVKCIDGYSWHEDLWECNGSVEVIGNIHENPELVGEHGLQ